MTDERKEGQQEAPGMPMKCTCQPIHSAECVFHDSRSNHYRHFYLNETQPEPRGSEALANAVLLLAKSMNQSNIWALRNEIMELCEGAAATAERTPQNPLDVAYNAIWKLWDKDPANTELGMALQAIQRIGQPPAERTPPQDEDAAFYKWLGSYDEPHPTPKTMAKAAWFAALADRQPAPPQPGAPEKEKP